MRKRLIGIHVSTFMISVLMTVVLLFAILKSRRELMFHHSCDMSGIVYGFGVAVNVLLFLAAFACYLNLYRVIRTRFLYALLSFLLLPLLMAIGVIITMEELSRETMAMVAPFLIIQTIQFFRFQKWRTKAQV